MALTTAEQVRLRIQDKPTVFDSTFYGDGTATTFALGVTNVVSATAFVGYTGGWTATGATVDATGFVAFSGVISANSALRVRGVHSVFSDDEIGHFTAVGGSVPGAALEAARTLAFDGLKRAKWAAPDGTTYSDVEALATLYQLIAKLEEEIAGAEVANGGFVEWALGQENW